MQLLLFAKISYRMLMSRNATHLSIGASAYIGACLMLILFPVKLVLFWLLAALAHELAHFTAIKLCRVKILCVHIGMIGARIITEPISLWQ